ncbi:hypothetical protein VNO77_18533 [Canavalia gladiata]|uniref:Uncharacterized protein n=1 Tax=Canavalia gladiata TaxID=3824 RepID=A0AAN9QKG5_CANGL
MRCFLPCFPHSKPPKQFPSANATPLQGYQTQVAIEPAILLARQKSVDEEEPIDCIAESNDPVIKSEEQSNNNGEGACSKEEREEGEEAEKKDEEIQQQESSESLFSLSIGSRKQDSGAEIEVNSPMQVVCRKEVAAAFGSNEKRGEKEESADFNPKRVRQESSESLFSLSIDSRKGVSSENEVNSHGRISSVLKPIENVTKERVVKARVLEAQKKDKENINLDANISTSFSSWLVESETTPISIKSSDETSIIGTVGFGFGIQQKWKGCKTKMDLCNIENQARTSVSS